MILRGNQVGRSIVRDGPNNTVHAAPFSDAGGLTQFGAQVHTLAPGWRSSDAHWHEQEDEFLYVLHGEVTVVEAGEAQVLRPGDAACWPAGEERPHHVENHSDTACTYLICGSRAQRDVVHYPELCRTLHTDGGAWTLIDHQGSVVDQGRREPPVTATVPLSGGAVVVKRKS